MRDETTTKSPDAWGECPACKEQLCRENASRLRSGKIVHVGCQAGRSALAGALRKGDVELPDEPAPGVLAPWTRPEALAELVRLGVPASQASVWLADPAGALPSLPPAGQQAAVLRGFARATPAPTESQLPAPPASAPLPDGKTSFRPGSAKPRRSISLGPSKPKDEPAAPAAAPVPPAPEAAPEAPPRPAVTELRDLGYPPKAGGFGSAIAGVVARSEQDSDRSATILERARQVWLKSKTDDATLLRVVAGVGPDGKLSAVELGPKGEVVGPLGGAVPGLSLKEARTALVRAIVDRRSPEVTAAHPDDVFDPATGHFTPAKPATERRLSVPPEKRNVVLPDEVDEDPDDEKELDPDEAEEAALKVLDVTSADLDEAVSAREARENEEAARKRRDAEQIRLAKAHGPAPEPGDLIHVFADRPTWDSGGAHCKARCGALASRDDVLQRAEVYVTGHPRCCPACAKPAKHEGPRLLAASVPKANVRRTA